MTNTLRYVLPVVSAIAAIAGITGYLHVRDERARRGDDLRMALRKLDEPSSQPTVDPPYRRRSIPPAAAAGTSPAGPNTVPRFDAIIGQERPDVEWQRQLSEAVTAAFAADGDVRVTSATCGASLCRLALALPLDLERRNQVLVDLPKRAALAGPYSMGIDLERRPPVGTLYVGRPNTDLVAVGPQ